MPRSNANSTRTVTLVLLCVAVLAAFGPVLQNGFTNFDDDVYVTENRMVQGGLNPSGLTWALSSGRGANWHPLTWLSHMLDWELFGNEPAGHHASSLTLHLANTLLLFALLHVLSGSIVRSALVAALFGVHPLHVESVVWVAERKDVLSTLFWLLSTLAYVRYAKSSSGRAYWISVGLLAAGLCAKPMLVTLPFTLLLLDYWPLGRWPGIGKQTQPFAVPWHLLREKWPMFVLVVLSSGVTVLVQSAGKAVRDVGQFPLDQRLFNSIVAYVTYLQKMAWPFDLAPFYPHPRGSLAWWLVAPALGLLIAITVAAVRIRRSRPYAIVGWLWYAGTLLPVIGVIQVGGQALADRYTYVPLIGIFVLLVWGLADVAGLTRGRDPALGAQRSTSPAPRLVVVGLLWTLVLCGLILTTRGQVRHWRDSVSLFEHTLAVTENNAMAHTNLGAALSKLGDAHAAIAQFAEAVRISPTFARAQSNLGGLLLKQGRLKEAAHHCAEAVRLRPDLAQAQTNLGLLLMRQGRVAEALQHHRRAVELEPGLADAHNHLGAGLLTAGSVESAMTRFREAIRIRPSFADAHNNLGLAYAASGQRDRAPEEFAAAIRIDPTHGKAHNNLGRALADAGRIDEAIPYYGRAIALDPDHAEAHNNLGMALAASGRAEQAVERYAEALRLRPDYPEALNNLGGLLVEAGRLDEGLVLIDRALEARPGYARAHSNRAVALYFRRNFGEAWKEVQLARQNGFEPAPRLIELLSGEMAEPRP